MTGTPWWFQTLLTLWALAVLTITAYIAAWTWAPGPGFRPRARHALDIAFARPTR